MVPLLPVAPLTRIECCLDGKTEIFSSAEKPFADPLCLQAVLFKPLQVTS
jgi:hypothetical protein